MKHSDHLTADNNVHLFRIVLAILVILSHSYPLVEGNEVNEPFQRIAGHLTLGRIAVDCFFLLSGFLITASWERNPSVRDFFARRVSRIYPGFFAVTFLSCFVLVPAVKGIDSVTYDGFLSALWDSIWLRSTPSYGIFDENPNRSLNGSLWSIPYEFSCYCITVFLGLFGLLSKRWSTYILLMCLVSSLVLHCFPFEITNDPRITKFVGKPIVWARLLPLYLTGVWGWIHRDRLRVTTIGLIGTCVLLAIGSQNSVFWVILFPSAGGYLIFCLIFRPRLRFYRLESLGDFSYGTYLYAFPIQQLIVRYTAGSGLTPLGLFLGSTPIVLVLAVLSWYFVEKPAMESTKVWLKRYRSLRDA
jgi:peptidoglycan/LPS O-acetylase OafA/YrhL